MSGKNTPPPVPEWAKEHAKKSNWNNRRDSGAVQGGFSNEVYRSEPVQEYFKIQWPVFGYIGAHTRSKKQDADLEKELREKFKLSPQKIGKFLISGDGRWLAERLSMKDGRTVQEELSKSAIERGLRSLKRSRS